MSVRYKRLYEQFKKNPTRTYYHVYEIATDGLSDIYQDTFESKEAALSYVSTLPRDSNSYIVKKTRRPV